MKAITDLQTKNDDFIPRFVYNTSSLTEAERLDIVSCVCNTTAFSWMDFTTFYTLNENSTKWHIEYNITAPDIILPWDNDNSIAEAYDLPNKTVRMTSDTLCSNASLWPSDNNSVSCITEATGFCYQVCMRVFAPFLYHTDSEKINVDPELLLESPILLTPEVLRVLVVQHARGESL